MSTNNETVSHAGRFVWRELVTPDQEAAKAFYSGLLGWTHTTQDMPTGPYTMFAAGEETTGGLMTLPEENQAPPHWLVYLTVDDVDATCAKITELGGTVLMPAFSIPGVGRMAVAADPQGGVFGPFRGEEPGSSDTESTPNNHTFCWSQLNTPDPAASAAFYSAIVPWTSAPMGPDTLVMSTGEAMRSTIMKNPQPGVPAHWMNYIAVEDVDASHDKAVSLGAQPFVPPTDIPGMGRFSVFADPTGAAVALWWQDPSAMPGA